MQDPLRRQFIHWSIIQSDTSQNMPSKASSLLNVRKEMTESVKRPFQLNMLTECLSAANRQRQEQAAGFIALKIAFVRRLLPMCVRKPAGKVNPGYSLTQSQAIKCNRHLPELCVLHVSASRARKSKLP